MSALRLEPYEPQPQCWHRRFFTSARCEKPPGHDDDHCGRDTAGRWHSWKRGERELDNPARAAGTPGEPT